MEQFLMQKRIKEELEIQVKCAQFPTSNESQIKQILKSIFLHPTFKRHSKLQNIVWKSFPDNRIKNFPLWQCSKNFTHKFSEKKISPHTTL